MDDFRQVTKFYDNTHIRYFTFMNLEDRPLSVVMRGVPYSISEEEVKAELIRLNYPIIRPTRLLKTSKCLGGQALFWQQIFETTTTEKLFLPRIYFFSVVSVEPRKRRSRDIPLSTNCQKYNHTKNFCRLEPGCVKYAGQTTSKFAPVTGSPLPFMQIAVSLTPPIM